MNATRLEDGEALFFYPEAYLDFSNGGRKTVCRQETRLLRVK